MTISANIQFRVPGFSFKSSITPKSTYYIEQQLNPCYNVDHGTPPDDAGDPRISFTATEIYSDVLVTKVTGTGQTSGTTLYIKLTAANAGLVSNGDTGYFWDFSDAIGTHCRFKVTAAPTINGANSYIKIELLENCSMLSIENADKISIYHAFDIPYDRSNVNTLIIWADNQCYVSSNDTYNGSPDDQVNLPANTPIIYQPGNPVITDPFNSADVHTLYVENSVNATVNFKLWLGMAHDLT